MTSTPVAPPKPPRNLRELVDQEREKIAKDAENLMYAHPGDITYALEVGKYRGVKEFLDRIDQMVKRNDEEN